MSSASLLLSAALALGTAAGFSAVGFLAARARRPATLLAAVSFAAFWHSSGIVAASQGLRLLAAGLGFDSMPLVVGLEAVTTPFYCLAAASLLYYVLFLVTGRASLATPIALYYLLLYPLLRYHVARADPIGYVVTDWQVNYVYAQPLQWWGYSLTLALVVAPVVLAIAAYAALAVRLSDAPLRYRAVCVAIGLALWVSVEALAFGSGLAATAAGEILRRALGIAAAGVVVAGHLPPAFARRRWGAVAVVRPGTAISPPI